VLDSNSIKCTNIQLKIEIKKDVYCTNTKLRMIKLEEKITQIKMSLIHKYGSDAQHVTVSNHHPTKQ
jgi:hypothetical protein